MKSASTLLKCCLLVASVTYSVLASTQASPFPGPEVLQIYQRLLPQIEKVPAFDHHAHPGFADDPDVDAMAAPPNATEALRTRGDNPELAVAAQALFGYPYNDLSPDHTKWLLQNKAAVRKQNPDAAYFKAILDQINIESSVANRAMMPDYLYPKRFPWVFFADSFMWPFNNERETARNPDEGVSIPLQEKMLPRRMQQENVSKLPADFDGYLIFISQVLEDNQKHGGIAEKFEVALSKQTLKRWLETFPDKITFATDCFPYNAVLGAEESYWLGAESSRTALAAALAEMVSEGEITEARALALARGYLHDNAVKLYEGKLH